VPPNARGHDGAAHRAQERQKLRAQIEALEGQRADHDAQLAALARRLVTARPRRLRTSAGPGSTASLLARATRTRRCSSSALRSSTSSRPSPSGLPAFSLKAAEGCGPRFSLPPLLPPPSSLPSFKLHCCRTSAMHALGRSLASHCAGHDCLSDCSECEFKERLAKVLEGSSHRAKGSEQDLQVPKSACTDPCPQVTSTSRRATLHRPLPRPDPHHPLNPHPFGSRSSHPEGLPAPRNLNCNPARSP